jgi:hypothetical protein
VIISKGGLLGMGKTILPSPNASIDAFQTIDTDQETVIRTASKEVKVVTPQSVNSYELRHGRGRPHRAAHHRPAGVPQGPPARHRHRVTVVVEVSRGRSQ